MVGISSCNTMVVRIYLSLSIAESVTSKMLIPVVLIFLSTTFAQELNAGEPCNFSNAGPGVCAILANCPSVYQQLMAGNSPDRLCGWSELEPIVCCPKNTATPAPMRSPVNKNSVSDGRGAIARRKCAEYARYVYSLKYPPIGAVNRRPLNTSDCAIKSQKLIVGGTKAEKMEFPHMAAVGYNRGSDEIGWFCGGSLISEKFVLTAAHCTFSKNWGAARWVRVGDLNLVRTDDDAQPVDIAVVERIRHPQYKLPSQYHDIALLRLASNVVFNPWVRPACLHTAPSTGTSKAIAVGWGHVTWGDEKGSNHLLKVTLPLVDAKTCNKPWGIGSSDIGLINGIVEDWMMCAGKNGSDTCQGDSGGPLLIYSDEQYECMYDLVGVTSFGKFCGNTIPGVYTRVYHYINWIESKVWSNE